MVTGPNEITIVITAMDSNNIVLSNVHPDETLSGNIVRLQIHAISLLLHADNVR